MKKYTVENDEGKRVTFEWDDDENPPTDTDIEEVFAASKQQIPQQEPVAQAEPVQEEKKGLLSSIGSGLAKGASAVGGVLSYPSRALGTLRTNPETGEGYDIKNQESNLLRPEINKVKGALESSQFKKTQDEELTDLMSATPGASPFTPELSKESAKGVTEFVGSSLADPVSYVGLGAKAVSAPLKKLGVGIESSVIGKGNKAIAKKERTTTGKLAERALEENVGGSLSGTIGKVSDKFEDVENNIQNILQKSVKEQPNLKINTDNVIETIKARIKNGEFPDLLGSEKSVISNLDELKESAGLYKMAGEIPVDKANQFKRMVGKKGFKKGMPTAETASKEMAYDMLDLALKDEIEKIVPAIKEQNAVYKKLIPIKQMAENRLPTAESNDLISLKGAASLATGNLPLYLTDLASKSGNVAQTSYNLGKAAGKVPISTGVKATTVQQLLNNMTEEEKQRFLNRK
jgi:hypothetical protein